MSTAEEMAEAGEQASEAEWEQRRREALSPARAAFSGDAAQIEQINRAEEDRVLDSQKRTQDQSTPMS